MNFECQHYAGVPVPLYCSSCTSSSNTISSTELDAGRSEADGQKVLYIFMYVNTSLYVNTSVYINTHTDRGCSHDCNMNSKFLNPFEG